MSDSEFWIRFAFVVVLVIFALVPVLVKGK